MQETSRIVVGPDGLARCWWCGTDPLYVEYHDREWGVPVTDDIRLFEKICLEGFQAGLAWITVLRKRPDFRVAFEEFDFHRIARFNEASVERLLQNEKIIRHRGKIEATINNAHRAIEMQDEFGTLADFFWKYEPATQLPFDSSRATTSESKALSKELKRRGWKFVGPTTCYAFMQAMGLVNDHLPDCAAHARVQRAKRPRKSSLKRS